MELAEAIVQDVERLTRRVVVPDVELEDSSRRAGRRRRRRVAGLPARGRAVGASEDGSCGRRSICHKHGGARLVLADQVGLGKTVQLALAAKLMALWGGGSVLALVPKPLLLQWQDELWNLLRLPSAIWTGAAGWTSVRSVHPAAGIEGLRRCPRRFGLVSTGLITQSDEVRRRLAAHAAGSASSWMRRTTPAARNLGATHRNESADPNNLLRLPATGSRRRPGACCWRPRRRCNSTRSRPGTCCMR